MRYQPVLKQWETVSANRQSKRRLIWIADKEKALNYRLKDGEMLLTVHRWFAKKECPGEWLYARLGELAYKVNKQL